MNEKQRKEDAGKREAPDGADLANLEDQFNAIAQEAIEQAERVKCGLERYKEGLQAMVFTLKDRIQAVHAEIQEHEEGDAG